MPRVHGPDIELYQMLALHHQMPCVSILQKNDGEITLQNLRTTSTSTDVFASVADVLCQLGSAERLGWRGHRAEGAGLDLPHWLPLPAWLKVKPKVTLTVMVTGGSPDLIPWGDWGLAIMLDTSYKHPRDGKVIQIGQAIRIGCDEPFPLHAGNAPS